MICDVCGRDLDDIWQDNMSSRTGFIICEDCNNDEHGRALSEED